MANNDQIKGFPAGIALLVVCIFFVTHVALHIRDHPRDPSQVGRDGVHLQQPPSKPETLEGAACSAAERVGSAHTEDHDKLDLCAQYRAAVAAETSAGYARVQTWLGALGFIAVVLTLIANVRATEAATTAANAAVAANEQGERQTRQTMRAYVGTTGFSTIKHRRPPLLETVVIQPIWNNTGQTPAKAVRCSAAWRYKDPNINLKEFDFPIQGTEHEGTIMIGPNHPIHSDGVMLTADEIISSARMQHPIWIWGWCEYDEVFKDGPRRRTEFFVEAEILETPTENALVQSFDFIIKFRSLEVHNDTDEDCTRPIQTMGFN